MSAWIVEKAHIDVLIAAARQYKLAGVEDELLVGQMLWRENHRSVNHRYSENEATPRYTPPPADVPALHPVAVLNALDCYDYQTCEHPDWNSGSNRARTLTARLRNAILAAHPGAIVATEAQSRPYSQHPVYEVAPWGFTALDQAYASAFAAG